MSYFHCDPFTNLPHINLPNPTTTPNPNFYSQQYQPFYQPDYPPVLPPVQPPVEQPVWQPVYHPVWQPVYRTNEQFPQIPAYRPVEQFVRQPVYRTDEQFVQIPVRRTIPSPVISPTSPLSGFFDFTDYEECELENTSGVTKKCKKRKSNKK